MAKRQRQRRKIEDPKLQMAPMIDVVFQLLIFFIVTTRKEDLISNMMVNRPQPDTKVVEKIPDMLEITVFDKGYVIDRVPYSLRTVEPKLTQLAGASRDLSVVVKCTMDSPHSGLIDLLDLCYKLKLTKISVFSL